MKRNVKQYELVGNSSYRSQRQLNVDEGKGNLVRKIEGIQVIRVQVIKVYHMLACATCESVPVRHCGLFTS